MWERETERLIVNTDPVNRPQRVISERERQTHRETDRQTDN